MSAFVASLRGGAAGAGRWLGYVGLLLRRGSGLRGRDARTPVEIPLLGWRDIMIRVWRQRRTDNLDVLAAGIAFFAFLALLPLVALLTMIYGWVRSPAEVVEDMRTLVLIMPEAAQAPVTQRVMEVTSRNGGWGLFVALPLTLYAGARSARSLLAALNLIYGEEDELRFVRRWGIAVLLATGGAGLTLAALLFIAAFGYIEQLLPGRSAGLWLGVRIAAWTMVAIGATAGIAALYRYAPSRRHARWAWILPGALVATLLWLLGSSAFSLYVANFARYDLTYGSVAAIAFLQLWLYLSAFILLLGAKLNTELERQTACDTTVGPDRPPGFRDAASADDTGPVPVVGDDADSARAGD